jgi:ATP-dependent DNA helicase RecG
LDVPLDELDTTPLEDEFKKVGKEFNKAVMKNLKLLGENNGIEYPTKGLLILLGYYHHVQIKCSRIKGKMGQVFIDRKEYEGNIFSQLKKTEQFIKNFIYLKGEIKGLQRIDRFEIPEEAIRESLLNAVVHRDYSNYGRDIKVGIYDDMIKIISPGGFPSTITQQDIFEGRSEIRNRVIARVFKELNYIEQWGSGIRRIISSSLSYGLKTPQIMEKGDFVEVILYRDPIQ